VSQRNGDKARFGRERQRKLLRRKRARELREALRTEPHVLKRGGAVGNRRVERLDDQDQP
jgi:hypothetical protein